MSIVGYIVVALGAYLLGSIPTGFLVAKARGIDIRSVGSGNIGATNVFRHLGVPAGLFVLLADAAKGWLAISVLAKLVSGWLAPANGAHTTEWLQICAGLCAILGHNYTCWLYFKGGKGIATSAGVVAALVPLALAIILVIWIVVLVLSRYASLASLAAALALPLAAGLTKRDSTLTAVTAAMAVLAVYQHRANIRRLLSGTENRIGAKMRARNENPEPRKTPR